MILSPRSRSVLLTLIGTTSYISFTNAQIKIVSPSEAVALFEDNGYIDGSTATFGAPYYGNKVIGKLLYRKPLFPDHPHCTREGYTGYEELDELFHKQLNITESMETTRHMQKRVMLVERGGCSFVTKVRVAQKFGAGAVLVMDKADTTLTKYQVHQVIMADDGYGQLVTIPSVFISREEGVLLQQQIEAAAAKDDAVIAELDWNIPSKDIVVMDLWMSPANKEAAEFLRGFNPVADALMINLQFIPHYDMFDLEMDYNNSCYEKNTFCAEDPDGAGPITGKDVVTESLRQLCVWDVNAKKVKGDNAYNNIKSRTVFHSTAYWKYVAAFADNCQLKSEDPTKLFGTKECSEGVMNEVGIDVEEVNDCMKVEADILLKLQIANTAWGPFALRINGWRYAGPIEPDLVRKAVCSGFEVEPDECVQMQMIENEAAISDKGMDVPWSSVILTIIGTILFLVGFSYLCCSRAFKEYAKQMLQEEVSVQVSNRLAEYQSLKEAEEGADQAEPKFDKRI